MKGTAGHAVGVIDAMDKAVGYVTDVDVVSLEILLEYDDVAFLQRRVSKMVYQQIDAHAR